MPHSKRVRTARGFTLIELLVVVAIIAIVAAIAVPGLLNATQRGRQGGTVADMRTVATTLERYATDTGRYPDAADMRTLSTLLEPDYITKLPLTDAWGVALAFERSADGRHYTLRSYGSDGTPQGGEPQGPTRAFEADIICSNGAFLQWPAGRQE